MLFQKYTKPGSLYRAVDADVPLKIKFTKCSLLMSRFLNIT